MITQTDKTHQTGNPELQTASTMSILGFCLYKKLWILVQLTEQLHHRMPLWIWKHVFVPVQILPRTCPQYQRSAEKGKFTCSDFYYPVCSACSNSLTTPMDYHLHENRAMARLVTIAVSLMPTMQKKGANSKMQRDILGTILCYLHRLILSLFSSIFPFVRSTAGDLLTIQCVNVHMVDKGWSTDRNALRADRQRMQEKGLTKKQFCYHSYV